MQEFGVPLLAPRCTPLARDGYPGDADDRETQP
jgi:hypothetical protein